MNSEKMIIDRQKNFFKVIKKLSARQNENDIK